jgi:uncharacterized protein with ParB-like and HNH nuclease domain
VFWYFNMKKYLLFFIIIVGTCCSAQSQYHRPKAETIELINNILKLREGTRLYESGSEGKSNHLILLQKLDDESFKQVIKTVDNKQITAIITKISWSAFKALGYNDNRSELYIYFNKKILVNNIPTEVFSLYIPSDQIDNVKSAINRLVDIAKEE